MALHIETDTKPNMFTTSGMGPPGPKRPAGSKDLLHSHPMLRAVYNAMFGVSGLSTAEALFAQGQFVYIKDQIEEGKLDRSMPKFMLDVLNNPDGAGINGPIMAKGPDDRKTAISHRISELLRLAKNREREALLSRKHITARPMALFMTSSHD